MKIQKYAAAEGEKPKFSKTLLPYLYIMPEFAILIVFLLVPLITAFVKSFYNYDGLGLNEFVGFKNYITLFTKDTVFSKSVINLLVLFVGMNICFIFPIVAAKQLNIITSERVQYVLRTVFMLPIVVPTVVTMMLWKFIYYPQIGVVAKICSYLGMASPDLLGNPKTALVASIIIGFPWISGLNFIIIYSALRGVDSSMLEAAKLDGASEMRIFLSIELPEVMPQIKSLYTIAVIGQFQSYEKYLILTQGGPNNATIIPGLHMYNMAFSVDRASQYGYSCAIAVVLFVATFILSKILLGGEKE